MNGYPVDANEPLKSVIVPEMLGPLQRSHSLSVSHNWASFYAVIFVQILKDCFPSLFPLSFLVLGKAKVR